MSNLPAKKQGSVRIIAAADLHLGRHISVPEVIENSFLAPLFTPQGAWDALVDLVADPEGQVDALVLAGDLFDREEDVLEAPFFFEKGLRRLSQVNKSVIAIAGNHDWRALQRSHRLLGFPNFRVLGANGTWESCEIKFGLQTVRFEGWSFPASQYGKNPLDSLPAPSHGVTTIGILHGDSEKTLGSPYAPFSVKQLESSGRDVWVLGHIHIPKRLSCNPLVISCGTLQGLDSSEQGERGAWMIDITEAEPQAQLIPLAALRFETLSLDIAGMKEEEYVMMLQKTLQTQAWGPFLKSISLEVVWKGQIDELRKKETLKKLEGTYFHIKTSNGFVDCHLRKSTLDLKPSIDLQSLAKQHCIIGHVARQILQLEAQEEQKRLKELFAKESAAYPHFALEFDQEKLKEQSYEVLFDLLEQRGEPR